MNKKLIIIGIIIVLISIIGIAVFSLNQSKCPSKFPYLVKTGEHTKVGLCYNKEEYAQEPVGGPRQSWCVMYPEKDPYFPDAIKRGAGFNCNDV